jgi:hypothetical protein
MKLESLRSAARRAVKHILIKAALEVTALPGAGRLFPLAAGRGVIFTLHHVRPVRDNEFEPNAHLSITPQFLQEAVVAAQRCGLIPVHLEDLPELLANSSDTRKFVCFTLDDGYRDNEKFAAPFSGRTAFHIRSSLRRVSSNARGLFGGRPRKN